jgi:hypothetical protein
MCSTPPAMATSVAPNAMLPAAVVAAVGAPAHIRSIA